MRGIIPQAPPGWQPKPPQEHPVNEGDPMAVSNHLWDLQQQFDERLHTDRELPYPRDFPAGPDQDQWAAHWMWGQAFALLSEVEELEEALEAQNADEETVDLLHFIMSVAEKMRMEPADLGRFESRFEAGRAEMDQTGVESWEDAYHMVLPRLVGGLSRLVGFTFKWWKAQPDALDREPHWQAVRDIDHANMCIASQVFDDADAMYQYYLDKNKVNHDRQEGLVAARADYQAHA